MKHISTLAILTTLIAAPASAQWYIGASAGVSGVKTNNTIQADQFLDLGFDSATSSSDKRDIGFRIVGGYQLHKNFAIECAYVDLGKFGFRTDVTPTGTLSGSMRVSGLDWAVVGALPISERVGVFARVGALSGVTKTSYSGAGSVELITGAETQKKRSTQLSYGAGASFSFSKNVAIRGEWSRYTKLGDALTGGTTNANLYSIGVIYRY
jgi:OmpA-OmpF porin, OOP family